MELTAEQIQDNWHGILGIIEENIEEPRKSQLKNLYIKNEEYLIMAPASGKKEYHGCYPGGLIEHILNVVFNSLELYELWKNKGANMDTFTKEELVFSALNHDLGKLNNYLPNTDTWRREKLGEQYMFNNTLPFASVPDRGLFILQQEGIKYSFNEMVAIQTHDGLYDEANKKYLQGFSAEQKPRTCLPYILHQADLMASRIEFEKEYIDLLSPEMKKPIEDKVKTNFKLEDKKIPIKQKAINSINVGTTSNLMNLLKNL